MWSISLQHQPIRNEPTPQIPASSISTSKAVDEI
jgi:hypothetical protein